MTIQRMDHVSVVVDDLEAAIAFFVELGMELEGRAPIEGPSVDRVNGLDGVRVDIAMMRTPDGHGRVELTKFHTPTAVSAGPENAPVNMLGLRSVMFAVDDIDAAVAGLRPHGGNSLERWRSTRTATGSATSAAPRGSSSPWPSSSAKGPWRPTCHQAQRSAWMERERHLEK
jgi:catechol 2,3-dioxygenase-like lactoylglutathione lyase family enzyme